MATPSWSASDWRLSNSALVTRRMVVLCKSMTPRVDAPKRMGTTTRARVAGQYGSGANRWERAMSGMKVARLRNSAWPKTAASCRGTRVRAAAGTPGWCRIRDCSSSSHTKICTWS